MTNSLLVKKTITQDYCDIGLSYYNYLEASYLTNTGKWLNDALLVKNSI